MKQKTIAEMAKECADLCGAAMDEPFVLGTRQEFNLRMFSSLFDLVIALSKENESIKLRLASMDIKERINHG